VVWRQSPTLASDPGPPSLPASVRVFRVKSSTTTMSHTAIKVIQLLQVIFFRVKLIALSIYTIKINPNCIAHLLIDISTRRCAYNDKILIAAQRQRHVPSGNCSYRWVSRMSQSTGDRYFILEQLLTPFTKYPRFG
jgi:hypothetical protein